MSAVESGRDRAGEGRLVSPFTGARIVIPTRNRADLAIKAIESVLRQDARGVSLLVSDNSSDEDERERLARYCAGVPEGRLRYVRPPGSLAMTPHWEWALEQALAHAGISHVAFLTDRMIFKRGQLSDLVAIAAAYPDSVVSYHHDVVYDHRTPVAVLQHAWTGKLLRVRSVALSRLYAESRLHPALPRMLNSLVPRTAIEAVAARFGSVFGSVSPDYNFGFRCLDVLESFIYYDRSPIIGYALARSNGTSFARGVRTKDQTDFMAQLGEPASPCFAAPAPEIVTVGNLIFHEYRVVAAAAADERFFAIEEGPYLAYLAREVAEIEDADRRQRMYAALEARGWHGRRTARPFGSWLYEAPPLRNVRTRLKWELKGNALKRFWLNRWRSSGTGADGDFHFTFDSREDALAYIEEFSRAATADLSEVSMLGAVELAHPEALAGGEAAT